MRSRPSLARLADDYARALHALSTIAQAHFDAGRLDEAAQTLEAAASMAAAPETAREVRAGLLAFLGQVLTYQASFVTNQYAEALGALERALQAAQTASDRGLLAEALDGLGLAHYHQAVTRGEGGFERAAAYFQHALQLREDLEDPRGLCQSLLHVGLAAERAGRFDEAQARFAPALALAEQHGLRREAAEVRRHLGLAHARNGAWELAQRELAAALVLLEAEGFRLALPLAHLAVGDALRAQAQWAEALSEYEIGSALAEALGLDRARAQAALSLGEWRAAQGDEAAARSYFERARHLAEARSFVRLAEAARARLAAG